MPNIIPPPPAEFTPDNQWAWIDFYKQIRDAINSASIVTWTNLDFSGSNLTDIATRNHNDLQNVQGGAAGDRNHLTTAQVTSVGTINQFLTWTSQAADPVAGDITAGTAKLYKNTTSGLVKLWVNDGGTLKSVTLT
jgi:hypothetical protein